MIKFFFTILFTLFTINCFASDIAVINIDQLIKNNKYYINFLNEIEKSQENYINNFNNEEIRLKNKLNEINESKLILSSNEINILIDEYNMELNKLNIETQKFNEHYNNEIIKIRNKIINHILILIENFVNNNNIKLVLDSTNYLIASNSIDITDQIEKELLAKNFDIGFDEYK